MTEAGQALVRHADAILTRLADAEAEVLIERHTSGLLFIVGLSRSGEKEVDLLPLSGLTHMVPDPVINEQLYSRIVFHFRKNLGQPGR